MTDNDLIYKRTARRIIDSPRSREQMLAVLEGTPPIVEIIRCQDCKHRLSSLYCEAWNNSPGFPCIGDEMFCSMAERRTDEPD